MRAISLPLQVSGRGSWLGGLERGLSRRWLALSGRSAAGCPFKRRTPGSFKRTPGSFKRTPGCVGYLKALWPKIVGLVFRDFRLKIDPGTPLDRRGLLGTSICTKNQPRRPILRPIRGNLIFWVLWHTGEGVAGHLTIGCLDAVWLKIFGLVFFGFWADNRPQDPSRRRGLPGTSILYQKSAPGTNSKTVSWPFHIFSGL